MPDENGKITSETIPQTNALYDEKSPVWSLIDSLYGGTDAMQDAGQDYLPKNQEESTANYNARKSRSFLFNATKNTINDSVALPFSHPMSVENAPERLEYLEDNVDAQGTNLTQHGRKTFRAAAKYGISFLFVEYPQLPKDENGEVQKLTLQQEQDLGFRPWIIHITAPNLLDWNTEVINNQKVLSMIKFREVVEVRNDEYSSSMVERIRVYTRETWEVWEQDPDDTTGKKWVLIDSGFHTFGSIPLIPIPFREETFMTSEVVFEDLAWLNLQHWQSESEQSNILHYARIPILWLAGITKQEQKEGITIGSTKLASSTNPDAKLMFVEPTGAAIDAGRQHGQDIEERMQVLGTLPFIRRSANVTATAENINRQSEEAEIESWIRVTEAAYETAYIYAGQWMNIAESEFDEDFNVNIYSDFATGLMSGEDFDRLLKARAMGEITQETFLSEIQKRGVISEKVEIQEEITKTAAEPLAIQGFGAGEE